MLIKVYIPTLIKYLLIIYIKKTKDNFYIFKYNIQQLKKAKITLITTVTKKESIIKYLQSQLNKYIYNNTGYFFTAYNIT